MNGSNCSMDGDDAPLSVPARKMSGSDSWVLVLYTGGTIGMVENEQGALVPAANKLVAMIRELWQMNDSKDVTEGEDAPLSLPCRKNGKRIFYRIIESQPLLDSSNMSMNDWIGIARKIKENYEKYDGFVVLHGTDTLCYTASALSFMLESLGKTIVITGSQVPIFEIRSDGINNFLASLLIAGNHVIPEVTVFFANKLYRGNRTLKISTDSEDAFDSPNSPPIASYGINIEVNFRQIFRPNSIEKFTVHEELNQNVVLLRIFPSITAATVQTFLTPPIEGVVLQSYGCGNIPDNRSDILAQLSAASERGVIIVNCSQCLRGSVTTLYATSKVLSNAGVIPGYDMTPEAALTKLSYVLSKKQWSLSTKKKMMMRNLRGELTRADEDQKGMNEIVSKLVNGVLGEENQEVRDAFLGGAMITAVAAGDVKKLAYYEKLGGDVALANADHRTPLHVACSEGREEIVEYILNRGASVHVKDRYGRTPLEDAILYNHHGVIRILLQCGAHLREQQDADRTTEAVCHAALKGDLPLLSSYCVAGASLNCQDFEGRTPLHMAVLGNQLRCAAFLVGIHVKMNVVDSYGKTAMDLMRDSGNLKFTDLLPVESANTSDKSLPVKP